ncbi:MAG: hypothetical protein ACR2J3_04370 [Aridibacter sp.]
MKKPIQFIFSIFILVTILFNSLPNVKACGPSYLEPVFEYKHAPENPYKNFADGKIGIIKPTYPRVVLYAAYRYLNGGAFSASEQKALVDVWEAYFNNTPYEKDEISESVKAWIEKRKTIIPKEEKTPEIYVERSYGGYDFFPNCTKNAFEVATQTLEKRIASYGSDNKDVKKWILAQDDVFQNCASGKRIPANADVTMPEWLTKDRQYQIAAAEFYSLNFDKAKEHFAEIAQDSDSTWQDVAAYLVGRTLIRQASLSKNKEKTETIYTEAEQQLQTVAASGGKYADSAEDLIGLIKYRIHPEERTHELAQNLSFFGGENFRQNLIDYTWLLDNYEAKALKTEEERKEALKPRIPNTENSNSDYDSNANVEISNSDVNSAYSGNYAVNTANDDSTIIQDGKEYLKISFDNDDYTQSWQITVKIDATNEEILAEAEKAAGKLTDKMKESVIGAFQNAYQNRFSDSTEESYKGGYYGEEKTTLDILPKFLRTDDLSDWLFTFQVQDIEVYRYSLSKYRQNNSDLWLLTALSKADKNSAEISNLLEASANVDRFSNAYPTIAYHRARIILEQGKQTEARKMLDEILESSLEMPISSRNMFLEMRMGLAENLEDFLKYSLRKPFTLSEDGFSTTIDEEIKLRKSYYDPEYIKKTKEEYEQEIDAEFQKIREIASNPMLNYQTADIINQNFPTPLLLEIQKSKYFPEYLQKRLAKAIWTRAILLEKYEIADKILPEFKNDSDEFYELFQTYKNAKTKSEKQHASLFAILKNDELSPYLSSGLGYPNSIYSGGTRWWCELYDNEYDETLQKSVPRRSNKPNFLSEAQRNLAQTELKKLQKFGNAPSYLADKVLEWAKRSPKDERIPESLYIIYEANGWDKYGCGGDQEKRTIVGNLLKRKYPNSKWTKMIIDSEKEN